MTPFQQHVAKWKDCTRCSLCEGRQRVVLAGGGPHPLKGSIPADILFLGEAPGDSEDMLGQPFTGPAGYLLARIMRESGMLEQRYIITNLVGCFPRDQGTGGKAGQPPREAILACRPRLVEFTRIVRPRVVIFVGKLAEQWSPFGPDSTFIFRSIVHPAHILRADISQQEFMVKRCVVALRDALSELVSRE